MVVNLLMTVFQVNMIICLTLPSRNWFPPNIELTRLWSCLQWFASSATINHRSLINSVSFYNHLWSKYFTTTILFCFSSMQSKMYSRRTKECMMYHWMLCWIRLQRASPRLLGEGRGFVYEWIPLEPQRNLGTCSSLPEIFPVPRLGSIWLLPRLSQKGSIGRSWEMILPTLRLGSSSLA